ncbi:MAG: hypothetical protein P8Z75_16655 [Gammaproteobacteria bacterium]
MEDEGTLAALRNMHCDIAQGYFISRPQIEKDIDDWLAVGNGWKVG